MELISSEQWVYIIFGAGAVVSTIAYVKSAVVEIKKNMETRHSQTQNSIEDTNRQIHNLELSNKETQVIVKLSIDELRRNIQELKEVIFVKNINK